MSGGTRTRDYRKLAAGIACGAILLAGGLGIRVTGHGTRAATLVSPAGAAHPSFPTGDEAVLTVQSASQKAKVKANVAPGFSPAPAARKGGHAVAVVGTPPLQRADLRIGATSADAGLKPGATTTGYALSSLTGRPSGHPRVGNAYAAGAMGDPALESIAVTPPDLSLATGSTLQFTATGTYSDGSTENLTSTVTWTSTATGVATINAAGLASAVAAGQTTIEAASGSINGSTTLTVATGATFSYTTGSLNTARNSQTATVLNNGMVLIAGGYPGPSASAELYNPATGTFTVTGSLITARASHTATLLNNGMVLIVGGSSASAFPTSAELYNPSTGSFTATGNLTTARELHTATLLPNGMVLITGGYSYNGVVDTAELYNPFSGTFTPTGNLVTARYGHTATLLNNGMVLIAGGSGSYSNPGVVAGAELYNPANETFSATTGSLNTARWLQTATLLNTGMVLIAGGYNSSGTALAGAELYNPANQTFSYTSGGLNTARAYQTATLLNNGMVLMAGGLDTDGNLLASAELYNPSAGTFTVTGSLETARYEHTATLLTDGLVLIAGGDNASNYSIGTAEQYEPATLTPPNLESIALTPATPTLSSGATQQFIATGTFSVGNPQQLASVTWSSSNPAVASITDDVTNLGAAYALANGATTVSACAGGVCGSTTVTVAGGTPVAGVSPTTLPSFGNQFVGTTGASQSVTLSNTGVGTLAIASIIASANFSVTTGSNACASTLAAGSSCMIYVTFSPSLTATGVQTGTLTITDNSGAVAGSTQTVNLSGAGVAPVVTVSTTPLTFGSQTVQTTSASQPVNVYNTGSATLNITNIAVSSNFGETDNCSVPGGGVIISGSYCTINVTFTPTTTGPLTGTLTITDNNNGVPGSTQTVNLSGTGTASGPALVSIAVTPANPSLGVGSTLQFTATGTYSDNSTQNLTATVTWSSSATGVATISTGGLASAAGTGQTTIEAASGSINGSTTLTVATGAAFSYTTGSLNTGRLYHTATLLTNGMVLIAGGEDINGNAITSAELYNPSTGTFTTTGSLNTGRWYHTATLLDNGMVLIAGGYGPIGSNYGDLASAELYNPSTGMFTTLNNTLNYARAQHTATVLNNGMVLLAGGNASYASQVAIAELYNPSTGIFTPTASLNANRYAHTATLLDNGMVLLAGGYNYGSGALSSAELYNPASGGSFSFTTGSLQTGRYYHSATLLNNGSVLIAGGAIATSPYTLASAELYNPSTGTFSYTTNGSGSQTTLTTPREYDTATLLNNGMVLMAGGYIISGGVHLQSAELYDPVAGTFTATGSLETVRFDHTATLLANGMVLVAGGAGTSGTAQASAELYQPATLTPPNLESIALSPSSPTLPLDTAQNFTATGTFSGSSTQQLASVTWSSSNPEVASITDDATNLGAAFGLATGTSTITACAGAICGSTTVTVPPAPVAGVSPTSLTFSSQIVGTTSASQPVTLSNTGTVTLTIASIVASTNFGVTTGTDACGSSLAAGGSCMIHVTFSPSLTATLGTLTGTLTITDNSYGLTGSTQTVSLSGTAIATLSPAVVTDNETITLTDTETFPDVLDSETIKVADTEFVTPLINVGAGVAFLSVGSLGFGSVTAGQTATQPLTLSNIGESPLTLTSATISSGSAFTISQMLCSNGAASLPTTLPAGGACLLTISYTAPAQGSPTPTATITFTDSAALSNLTSTKVGSSFTQSLALSGAGSTASAPPPPPAIVSVMDTETITTTDTETFPDVFDRETIKVMDMATVTALPLIAETLSTNSLSFGSQTVGATTPAQSVTLTSSGTASLTITSITASGDFALVPGLFSCPYTGGTLPLGDECGIYVTFTPTALGARTGSVTITDNGNGAVGSTQTIGLTGTGTSGNTPTGTDVTASVTSGPGAPPTSVTFSNVTKAGNTTVTASSACMSGPANFSVGAAGGAGTCVDVSTTAVFAGMITITVSFNPANYPNPPGPQIFHLVNGAWVNVTVAGSVNYTNDTIMAQVTSLSPFGIFVGTPAVSLEASQGFGSVTLNSSSSAQQLTLTNTGAANLVISTAAVSGTNAADFAKSADTCTGATVLPNGTCSVTVTFNPTAEGARTATLTFTDTAANSPQTVALSGTGADFSLAAASGSSTSATVAPGQSATYTLSLAGLGGFNQSVSLTCTGAPSQATCPILPNPLTVGSSATSATVTIYTTAPFTAPSASGPRSQPLPPVPPLSPGLRGLGMLALILAAMAWAIRRRRQPGVSQWRSTLVPLAAGLLLALALAGCHSACTTTYAGTPAGTYTLTVTGTTGSGSSALSHSVTLTLTVS